MKVSRLPVAQSNRGSSRTYNIPNEIELCHKKLYKFFFIAREGYPPAPLLMTCDKRDLKIKFSPVSYSAKCIVFLSFF